MKILLSKFHLFYHSLSQATELTESVRLFLKCSTYFDENQWNLRFWREINIKKKTNISSTDLPIAGVLSIDAIIAVNRCYGKKLRFCLISID